MRLLLFFAILIPLAIVVGWALSVPIVESRRRREHIERLEEENRRLDDLIDRERGTGVRDEQPGA